MTIPALTNLHLMILPLLTKCGYSNHGRSGVLVKPPPHFLKNKMEVWQLYRTAGERTLPSQLVALSPDNAWLCYTFNRTVWRFGNWVEAKLSERDKEHKPVWTLEELLRDEVPAVPASKSGSAAQLVALLGGAVKIKP